VINNSEIVTSLMRIKAFPDKDLSAFTGSLYEINDTIKLM
jgi:hypothetical protein